MEREILTIAAGAEAVLVVKDPTQQLAIWLRGWTQECRVMDLRPEFTLHVRDQAALFVDPRQLEFRGVIQCQTFTLGWPSAEQLMKPIPLEFDPDYFPEGTVTNRIISEQEREEGIAEFQRGLTLFSTYVLQLGLAGLRAPGADGNATDDDAVLATTRKFHAELSLEDAKMLAKFLPIIMGVQWEILGLKLLAKILLEEKGWLP